MLNSLSNQIMATHMGQAGGRGLSPRLWAAARGSGLAPDGFGNAFSSADDFDNFGAIAPAISGTTAGVSGGYGYYVDTATSACSITQIATEVGGVIRFATGATDNHEAWLSSGGNTGVLGKIDDSDPKKLIFETRVRFGQVASMNAFIGLAEEGLAAANTITDAGALADKDFIGFAVDEADSDALDFIYRKAGQTLQTKITGLQALVANTWYKLGFVFDPAEPESRRIKVFVNNVENATMVTATEIAAATFPDAEELAFLAGIKNGAASALTMDVDWRAFHQEA